MLRQTLGREETSSGPPRTLRPKPLRGPLASSAARRGTRTAKTLVDGRPAKAWTPVPPDPYHPGPRDVTTGPDDVPLYFAPRVKRYGSGDPRSYQSPFLNAERIRYYEDATYGSIYDPNPDPHGDPTVGFPQAYDRV